MSRHSTWTTVITEKAARNILYAARSSETTKPLNRYLTINNLTDRNDLPQPVVTKFLKYVTDWLRYYSQVPLHAVWVLENPSRATIHVHILLHIPEALTKSFNNHLRAWARRSGVSWAPRAIHSKSIDSLMGLVGYILKGTDEAACRTLQTELMIDHQPQGPIFGKRCGTSQAIGADARYKAATSLPRRKAA